MPSESPPAPPSIPLPAVAAPIDIAQQPDPEDIWPRNPVTSGFVWLSLVWFALLAIALIARFTRMPMNVALGVGGAVFGLLLLMFLALGVRAFRRRARRKAAGGQPSNRAARLRLIGPPQATADLAATLHDHSFEPAIFRSFHSVCYAVMKDGRVKTYTRRGRRRRVSTRVNRRGLGWLSLALAILASLGTVLLLQLVAFGSLFPFTAFHIFAAIVGVGLFDALLMPIYVRIAPGVLDVMSYSILGMGKGIAERYDLRTARVCVDLDTRYARIDDMSRAQRPVLYLHLPSLRGGPNTPGADILRAAISAGPTPPLPSDELLG